MHGGLPFIGFSTVVYTTVAVVMLVVRGIHHIRR